jgi:diacylglycerol kinase family enzyme
LAAGATQIIDVGQVNDHYFVNNSAVGLEPMVTMKQAEMRWLKGPIRYLVAAIQTIFQTHEAWQMRLDWPNGSYEGAVTLISVGNSPITGGVFRMTPLAKVDDGLIDFVCGMGMYRITLFALLPRVLMGSHITYSAVIYKQTSGLKIKAITPTPIQADGEIISEAATEICYKILPQRLKVIV